MSISSSDRFPAIPRFDRNQERAGFPPLVRPLLGLLLCLVGGTTAAAREREAVVAPAPIAPTRLATGSIFDAAAYAPLTSGLRASRVGDILTIVLTERIAARKSTSSATDRSGSFGVTPPSTGPLALFNSSDVSAGGNQGFKGKGEAAQSNALSGEVSVTVSEVLPNGLMRVSGEKVITLSRGDERVQISGIVRAADVTADNRVLSIQVADARIRYTGKGHVSDASRPGWLQRLFAKVSPF